LIFSWTELVGAAGGVAIVWVLARYAVLLVDLRSLKMGVRVLLRSGSQVKPVRLRSGAVEGIWRSILLLSANSRSLLTAKEIFDETISLSARLAGASDGEKQTSEVLLDVLVRQTGPEVIGAAVVLCDADSGEARVVHQVGLPQRRTDSALLMCFEAVLYQKELKMPGDEHRHWGYRSVEDGTCFDFSSFGIGLCLIVPLYDASAIRGGIWLGFREGGGVLSARRKEFVKAVAEHAAASFNAAEKAKERTEKSVKERDFLLGLSHDMRAPSNRALCVLREITRGEYGKLSHSQEEQLLIAEKSIQEQMALLADVMDFAKHQKGFLKANRVTFELKSAIRDLVHNVSSEAKRNGLTFTCQAIPHLAILCDLQHFRRMLNNIVTNAIRYTDKGGISLDFKLHAGYLDIVVADTGCGVDPDDRPFLFSEFCCGRNRADSGSVGLGLTVTKALAELNSGEVFFQPNPSGGSIFSLRLACCAIDSKVPAAMARLRCVVIVDDDPAACRSTGRMLSSIADTIIPAGSLKMACELISSMEPELVVTDYHLGDGDARPLIADTPGHIPIILLTGDSGAFQTIGESLRSRVTVLEKPIVRSELLSVVESALEKRYTQLSKAVNC